LKVSNQSGYYDFDYDESGLAEVVSGPAEVMQAAELRLALWMGAWCLDRTEGFPWDRFVGRKDCTPELLEKWLRLVILRDERVRSVNMVSIEVVDKDRIWRVAWTGQTASGEALLSEFAIPAP
jgi:hypothetical protein